MRLEIVILRPEPGASETASRARALGLEAVVSPIFETKPLAWRAPQGFEPEAVLLTSANGARHSGDQRLPLLPLPCFTVGPATAAAARSAGFADVRIGPSDGAAALEALCEAGVTRALHLCGREHLPMADPRVQILSVPVYASDPVASLAHRAGEALRMGALALLHSPRSATHFAGLIGTAGLDRAAIGIAAISGAAAAAVGAGWRVVGVAEAPRDEALLELAAKLCKTDAERQG